MFITGKREPGVAVWKTMMQKPEELPYEQEKTGRGYRFYARW